MIFNFTFSVVCSANENMKEAGYKNLVSIRDFEQQFIDKGYNTRIFNPDGQDDIGGGCGQLWYVQQWMREREM
jgi:23S rRNA (adenine2503-C2)-methyltransferase